MLFRSSVPEGIVGSGGICVEAAILPKAVRFHAPRICRQKKFRFYRVFLHPFPCGFPYVPYFFLDDLYVVRSFLSCHFRVRRQNTLNITHHIHMHPPDALLFPEQYFTTIFSTMTVKTHASKHVEMLLCNHLNSIFKFIKNKSITCTQAPKHNTLLQGH